MHFQDFRILQTAPVASHAKFWRDYGVLSLRRTKLSFKALPDVPVSVGDRTCPFRRRREVTPFDEVQY